MNETSLSDDLSIRTLTLTVRQQAYLIGHLSERVTALEKAASSPQDTLNRRLKALDEKANAGGLTCDESDERTWLVKRINQMTPPPTVGNAYTSPEGWEAKQKAVEARCVSKWRDARADPPKTAGLYLIHATDGTVDIMPFTGFYWTFRGKDAPILHIPVTHWQELPPPPQATEKV